jgi:gamma-glutamylcyclotransferase (GGCT)/AIG2-like uncharacterized protein YtfP
MTHAADHLPLFVYGTLMSGQPAHKRLAGSMLRLEKAQLQGVSLHVVSWYPLAAPGDGEVHGEVVWLRSEGYAELLTALDAYEGDEYTRVVRSVRIPGGDTISCWVYLATAATAARYPRVPDGDWRTHLNQGR